MQSDESGIINPDPAISLDTQRRGTSARERPKIGTRERIRQLLGRAMGSTHNTPDEEQDVPFTITPRSYQQPVAWSASAPTLAMQPMLPPSSTLNILPPYRPSPNYPTSSSSSYPPPYFHPSIRVPHHIDVDERSHHESRRQHPSRPATAATIFQTQIPGEIFREEDPQLSASVSSGDMAKVFEDIRSPLSPRMETIRRASISNVQASAVRVNPRVSRPRGNSIAGAELVPVVPAPPLAPVSSNDPEEDKESSTPSPAALTVPRLSLVLPDGRLQVPNMNRSSSISLTSPGRFMSRPVSSTTLPTPGLGSSSANLPGTINRSERANNEFSFHARTRSSSMSSESNIESVHGSCTALNSDSSPRNVETQSETINPNITVENENIRSTQYRSISLPNPPSRPIIVPTSSESKMENLPPNKVIGDDQ